MISGRQAWGILVAGIVGYEVLCADDDLLSAVVDEWLVTRPVLTRAVIAAVSLHLANLLPWYADVLSKRLWREVYEFGQSAKGNLWFTNWATTRTVEGLSTLRAR